MYYNIFFTIKILVELCTGYFDGQTFLFNRRIVDSVELVKATG